MKKIARRNPQNLGIIGLVIAVLVLGVVVFQNQQQTITGQVTGATLESPVIQCNRDFAKTYTLQAENELDPTVTVTGITWKAWQLVNGDQIPVTNPNGSIEIVAGEKFLVVSQVANATDVQRELEVTTTCQTTKDDVFSLTYVPEDIDASFENSKITGPASATNLIPIPQDDERSITVTFNGQSKTRAAAIVVYDADKDIIDSITSELESASVPNSHSNSADEIAYAFELGTFDGGKDLSSVIDVKAENDATIAEYNATWTIYQYQTGYINTRTGDYDIGPSIEDDSGDAALLPTDTGTLWLEITA